MPYSKEVLNTYSQLFEESQDHLKKLAQVGELPPLKFYQRVGQKVLGLSKREKAIRTLENTAKRMDAAIEDEIPRYYGMNADKERMQKEFARRSKFPIKSLAAGIGLGGGTVGPVAYLAGKHQGKKSSQKETP